MSQFPYLAMNNSSSYHGEMMTRMHVMELYGADISIFWCDIMACSTFAVTVVIFVFVWCSQSVTVYSSMLYPGYLSSKRPSCSNSLICHHKYQIFLIRRHYIDQTAVQPHSGCNIETYFLLLSLSKWWDYISLHPCWWKLSDLESLTVNIFTWQHAGIVVIYKKTLRI